MQKEERNEKETKTTENQRLKYDGRTIGERWKWGWETDGLGASLLIKVMILFPQSLLLLWCDVMWCDVMWCDVRWGEVRWGEVRWEATITEIFWSHNFSPFTYLSLPSFTSLTAPLVPLTRLILLIRRQQVFFYLVTSVQMNPQRLVVPPSLPQIHLNKKQSGWGITPLFSLVYIAPAKIPPLYIFVFISPSLCLHYI